MNKTSVRKVRPNSKKPACESGKILIVDILGDETSEGESKVMRRSVNKPACEGGHNIDVKETLSSWGDVETWSQDSVFVAIPGKEDGNTGVDPDGWKLGPEHVVEDSLESQPTGNPPSLMINNWTEEVIGGEPTDVGTTGKQASEPSTSYPTVGSSVFSALIKAFSSLKLH